MAVLETAATIIAILKDLGAVFNSPTPDKKEAKSSSNVIATGHSTVNVQNIVFQVNPGTSSDPEKLSELQKLLKLTPFSLTTPELAEKNKLIETDPSDDDLLRFIQNSPVMAKDYSLWKAALILRKTFNPDIKADMIEADPVRGKNIANLCSAKYLENEILQVYKTLSDAEALEDFGTFYESLVTKTPASIFVAISHTPVSLEQEITEKIEFGRRYSAPYIKIHALGRLNVDLARMVIQAVRIKENLKNIEMFSTRSHLDAKIDISEKPPVLPAPSAV